MKVAVVGAGIAGILTAHTFKQAGHLVAVFERDRHIGGVWSPTKAYDGLRTQNTGVTYTLPCFTSPKDWHEEYFPTAAEYHAYLQSFVDRHGLGSCISLGTEVQHASNSTPGQAWLLQVKGPGGTIQQLPFDFLVICSGQHSEPHMPTFPGQADFTNAGGRILHTSELQDLHAVITGKHAVVVGNGRSGNDVATNCAKSGLAKSVTQVYRRSRWPMVRYLGKALFVDNLYATRFAFMVFPAAQPGRLRAILEMLLAPLLSVFWWTVELVLRLQLRLSALKLVPDGRLAPRNIGCTAAIAPPEMHALMHQGKLRPIKGQVAKLSPGCIHLEDGSCLEADIIIMATGFDPCHVPMLSDAVRAAVWDPVDGSMLLHRKVAPLNVPNLAFVGFFKTTLSSIAIYLQAVWALAYAEGRLQLPPEAECKAALEAEWAWAAAKFNSDIAADVRRNGCGFFVAMEYHDVLLRDLGVQDTRLRPDSWFAETFQVLRPQLYQALVEQMPKRAPATSGA